MDKIKILKISTIILGILFLIELTPFSFFSILEKIKPCADQGTKTLPCYFGYDLFIAIPLAIIFVISAIILGYSVYKNKK